MAGVFGDFEWSACKVVRGGCLLLREVFQGRGVMSWTLRLLENPRRDTFGRGNMHEEL